jgi:translocator protein
MTQADAKNTGSRLRRFGSLAVFLVVVIGVGALIGIGNAPGDWYAGLDKPPFNPPNWVFGPVWTILYICIAVAGWRIWKIAPSGMTMKFWYAQMAANWIWSPFFFSLQLLWPALAICLVMWILILAVVTTARPVDPLASWLMVPYLAWVGFAGLLNASLAWLN